MGTRAAAFTAKIHNLQDYNARIQHGILPLPSGVDVANTLKYFSQTLLSVLKDVPSISLDVLRSPEKDHARTSLFPSLDYKGLYHAIVELVDAVPLVQHGAHALGHTILHALACLVPFLEHEYMDTLPYLVASSMALFPSSLHKDIVDMLCNHLLPFTFVSFPEVENQNYASMSTAAVLMMIFQYTDCSAFHCQVLECLMSLKKDIIKDLLCVIAHGTAKARCHAVELLFQYLPTLNPALLDRKGIGNKLNGWKALLCQRENCLGTVSNEAVKMCFNHSVAIGSGEQPPPLYVCEECAVDITMEHGSQHMTDVLLPMDKVSVTCENKDCKGSDKSAVATCFSIECASQNGHRPIRYCSQCHILYHNEERGIDHIVHTTIPSPWNMEPETQSYMVEAIINLLREAEPVNEKHTLETVERPYQSSLQDGEDNHEVTTVEERQLLSRYGIWLLVGLCTPTDDTPVESLGRLLSMLFQWFHYTACLPDDQAGNALERLKAEYIHGWLMEVVKSHFEVFVSCLIPHPVDYAQVGGHWETWPSYTNQIKEGFKRLLCLVPYDIITSDVWEYIMPYWMEAFRHEIPEGELAELKILLSKILDPDISPLGFDTKKMYKFLSVRFESSIASVQEQALSWLQILTLLEVPVPLDLLLDMFMIGVESTTIGEEGEDISSSCHIIPSPDQLRHLPPSLLHSRVVLSPGQLEELADDYTQAQDNEYKTDGEINLACYILMLDIIIKQMELQEIPAHKGLEQKDSQRVLMLLKDIIKAPWIGIHTCSDPAECNQCIYCEVSAIWFQLCLVLIEYFCPVMEVTMADIPADVVPCQMSFDQPFSVHEHSEQTKTDSKNGQEISLYPLRSKDDNLFQQPIQKLFSDDMSENDVIGEISLIQKATVEECAPELDTVAIMPTENVVAAFAREVTLTEDDVAGAKCTVESALLVDENDQAISQTLEDSTFWTTSEGRFKFTIEELPPQLQLFFVLLKGLADHKDADVLYHILSCLKVMCLHAEVLNKAAHSHRGFLIWCQENLLINNLWKLLQTEFSHIAQLATSLLLHCITLPCGADMFWKVLEQDFHNDMWRSRYAAVEKVTMIAHFVEPTTVKNSPLLQSSLANAFCYLVHCLDDIQPTVSQRALLNLETIKTASLKLLLWCLEVQFDSTIVDRPMILQTAYQLYNHLSSRRFLTWEFFLNRFDALFLEAQINLERTGEISYTRDLKNTNINSEMFQRKLNRAHEALSLVNTSRSLTVSFGTKWPYKRAMSAPCGMISKQEKWVDKEKIYGRQSSAPVLKRKSSKLIGSAIGPLGPLQHFPNSFFPDGHMKEIMQEETHFLNVLHRGMEMEDHDRDTLHLLIFLLMQFLSRPDPSHPVEEKVMTRSQHIVVKHLNILLGYSQAERKFLIPPYKVRCSAVFNAFMMSMPRVLDYNFSMGNIILNSCLSLLVYCPSPQKFPHEHYSPSYSLWLLEPYCRHSWLLSTLVIMYKYHYDSYSQSRHIQLLITIVLNTLEAQRHKCKHPHEPLLSPLPSRSRDLSTASADTENVQEKEKEFPLDTATVQEDSSRTFVGSGFKLKGFSSKSITADTSDGEAIIEQLQKIAKDKNERQQWKAWKIPEMSCSSDGEDAEPELEAIPESPKSENSEQEQYLSELTCIPQTAEQACVTVVKDSFPSIDQIVVTDPWSTIADEATLVQNTGNSKKSVSYELNNHKSDPQRHKLPERPPSLPLHRADDNHIIEKAALEVMEKHIKKVVDLQDSTKQYEFDAITDADTDILNENKTHSLENPQPSPFYMQLKPQTTVTPDDQLGQLLFSFRSVISERENATNTDFLSVEQCHQVGEITSSRAQMNSVSTVDDKAEEETKINISLPSMANISKKNYGSTSDEENNSYINFKGFNSKGSDNVVEVTKVCSLVSTSLLCSETKKYNEKDSLFQTEVNKDFHKKDRTHSDNMIEKDCERNAGHSKYPKSKLFLHSKKKDHDKIPCKSDVLGSANLTVPIFRPPLERLLPIGMPEKVKKLDISSASLNKINPVQLPEPSQPDEEDAMFFSNRDLFEDKGVQTEHKDLSLGIPAPERLLPVGPLPSRKDGCITSTFKTKWEDCAKEKICPKYELLATSAEFPRISETFPIPCNLADVENIQKSLNYQTTEIAVAPNITLPLLSKPTVEELRKDISNDMTNKTSKNDCLPFDRSFETGSEATVHKTLDVESREMLNNLSSNKIQGVNNKKMETFSPKQNRNAPEFNTLYDEACKSTAEIMTIYTEQVSIPELLHEKGEGATGDGIHHQNNANNIEILPAEKVLEFKHNDEVSQRQCDKAQEDDVKCKLHYRQKKQRKSGLSTIEAQRSVDLQNSGMRRMRKIEAGSISSVGLTSKRSSTSQSSSARCGEDFVVERCTDCGAIIEEYSDEELGLCIVILATFVHREPTIAAPLLPEMLRIVARIASSTSYPWQSESNIHLPGGSVSVARQFLRCTLHQLAPNGVFIQIFQSHSIDSNFFKTMAAALADFTEVNQVTPLLLLFENLNDRKHLHHESVFHILDNVATYLDCLPVESSLPPWNLFLQQLELFLRKFLFTLSAGPCHLNNVIHIMLAALKMPIINSTKSILDPFSKILSHAIQHSSLDYHQLSDLCHFCYRNLSRERDKLVLTRTAIFELVQALKFKSSVPDANLLMLVQFVLEDSGGSLGPSIIVEGLPYSSEMQIMYNTSASECMRQYLNDALEFVADVHTLTKVKNMLYGTSTHLNEETLGGQLKAGIAQYLAIEISKGNGRDNRAIGRYLPWLYHPPTSLQQGPKEFIDCVAHIRLLSWLLLGALIHSALLHSTATFVCQPIPLEANSHIAEHIQVILAGFAEQSKVSVLHMSSLFHAFILCQLWTMYCEHMVSLNPPGSEQNQVCSLTLTDFWAKITPGILQLVCHSKVEEQYQLAEMVSLHFLSLMEALLECNSTVLARLLPMWTPVLYSFQGQLPGHLHVRLHSCLSWQPPSHTREEVASIRNTFLKWLQRLHFKMGQIELQSSTATQFYSL